MNVTQAVCRAVTWVAPYAHILLGQPAFRSPTCLQGKLGLSWPDAKRGLVLLPLNKILFTLSSAIWRGCQSLNLDA